MMEGEVRKKGMLYQQQQRFGKKWKKVWAVAVADSTQSLSCLELYEYSKSSMKEGKKRAEGKKVIVMRDCVKIKERETEGCPKECSTFLLETADKTHTFASPAADVHSWIIELCRLAFPLNQTECKTSEHLPAVEMQDNTLYGTTESMRDFLVIAVATDAALRCNLYGEYCLAPQDDSLLLKHYKTKEVLLTWPYRFVRKFGQDMLSFNFEAGRRCESGEGYFEFATCHSDLVFAVVSEALKRLPKGDASGTRPKEKRVTRTSRQSHTPPVQDKHPKKKLTTSFSMGSISAGHYSGRAMSAERSPPLTGAVVRDPVYAMVKPKAPSKSSVDYKNQQLGPFPDEDVSAGIEEQEEGGEEKEEEMMTLEQLGIRLKHKPDEDVYSEVNILDEGYGNQADANVDPVRPYKPHLGLDLQDPPSARFDSDYSLSDDASRGVEDGERLDAAMERLDLRPAPYVFGAEGTYSQISQLFYRGGVDGEVPVDNAEDHGLFYSSEDSYLVDPQADGYSTYDNLPKRY